VTNQVAYVVFASDEAAQGAVCTTSQGRTSCVCCVCTIHIQQGHTTRTIIFAYVVYALCTYQQGRTSCVCNNMHLPGPLNVCIHQPGPSNLCMLYVHYAHTSRAIQVAYALLCTYQDHQIILNTNQDHNMCVFCVCTMHLIAGPHQKCVHTN